MKGKFIVIEGIDGCGKTTQIDEISKWLPKSGLMKKGSQLITTREPVSYTHLTLPTKA